MRRSHWIAWSLLLVLCLSACSKAPARPNVLLITVDTLRADRIHALYGGNPTTPRLDELVRDGVAFPSILTPRAKTTPAIASLMTGLYPHEHGVRELLQALAPAHPTLAERLSASGYRTHAIIGNFVLRQQYSGLARGFDTWIEELPDAQGVPPEDVPQRRARSLSDAALALLGQQGEQPWMLWLHYMDPHGLYDAPAEHQVFRAPAPEPIEAGDTALHKLHVAEYNAPPETRMADGRIDAAAVRALYDAEVRYADEQIGRVLDALRTRGQLENTVVIITADHGESLGEHRYYFEHGRNAYEPCAAVPLIVRAPGGARGVRGSGDVSLCDLAPSLLAWLGLPELCKAPTERETRGQAFPELFGTGSLPQRPVFTEKIERASEERVVQHKAVRMGPWKRVRRYATVEGAVRVVGEELYELSSDPYESRNVMQEPPPLAPLARLDAELLRFSASDVHFADLAEKLAKERARLEREDPATLRVLKALGY